MTWVESAEMKLGAFFWVKAKIFNKVNHAHILFND
jgi:hypothetical protein